MLLSIAGSPRFVPRGVPRGLNPLAQANACETEATVDEAYPLDRRRDIVGDASGSVLVEDRFGDEGSDLTWSVVLG